MSSKKTILVCPLNWGLGHATRMIPIIDNAISQGDSVIIASDGDALFLLQNHYNNLRTIELPNLNIQYGIGAFAPIKFLFSIPKILKWIKKDRAKLNEIVEQERIDLIISDNRWGLWHKSVKSVFVTHQVMVKIPQPFSFLEKIGFLLQQRFLNHFDEIWIPDYKDQTMNLSGDLSHKYSPKKKTKYIGILSQFHHNNQQNKILYDIAVILSGPEPHRSILEKELIEKIAEMQIKAIIVGGRPSQTTNINYKKITYIPFADTLMLQEIYEQSKYIICRSGYTSLMDLVTLGKPAILIPTPSQTEQEYLAKYTSDKGWFISLNQRDIKTLNSTDFKRLQPLYITQILLQF